MVDKPTPQEEWDFNKFPMAGTHIRYVGGRLFVRAEITPGAFSWIEISAVSPPVWKLP